MNEHTARLLLWVPLVTFAFGVVWGVLAALPSKRRKTRRMKRGWFMEGV